MLVDFSNQVPVPGKPIRACPQSNHLKRGSKFLLPSGSVPESTISAKLRVKFYSARSIDSVIEAE